MTTTIYETTGAPARGFCFSNENLGDAVRALAEFVDDNPDFCLNAIAVTNELEGDFQLFWTLYAVFDDMGEPITPFLELVSPRGAATGS